MSANPKRGRRLESQQGGAEAAAIAEGRYRVDGVLGKGGTGTVYKVYDTLRECSLALKMLHPRLEMAAEPRVVSQFEREYHMLTQLCHPRVVKVYDFGVEATAHYYTMEWLDGGDVRELAPMPWQEVCSMAYEACSVLSLLHSRRLVHRDLTPRNIRRTADGRSKVIDFGLLSTMGAAGGLAGTPAYVAPEVVHGTTLDGRCDLYSLGATMYYALTGVPAFPVRTFGQLRDAWRSRPAPITRWVSAVPSLLQDLVLSLLRVDMDSRPKSAAHVMDLLQPLLPAPPAEELAVGNSHLASPQLVGRGSTIMSFRKQMLRSHNGRGGGFLLEGDRGSGRTRMLDAFALEAKLSGAIAVRCSASDACSGTLGVACMLAAQLHRETPVLLPQLLKTEPGTYRCLQNLVAWDSMAGDTGNGAELCADAQRATVHGALRAYFVAAARQGRTVALAVDDLELADDASAGWLMDLASVAESQRLVMAISVNRRLVHGLAKVVSLLTESCEVIQLDPLSHEECVELLRSVFGDVPHLHPLSRRLYELSGGRPGDCMRLAQHLVDLNVVQYRGGSWNLPEQILTEFLPAAMEDMLRNDWQALDVLARKIVLAAVLWQLDGLDTQSLTVVTAVRGAELQLAIRSLTSQRLLAAGQSGYVRCPHELAQALLNVVDAEEQRAGHERLLDLLDEDDQPVVYAYHLAQSGKGQEGVALLLAHAVSSVACMVMMERGLEALGAERLASLVSLMLDLAEEFEFPLPQQQIIWTMLGSTSAVGAGAQHFYRVSDVWRARLVEDAGVSDWYRLTYIVDPVERITEAQHLAGLRHARRPTGLGWRSPAQATRQVCTYVFQSNAIALRTLDLPLLHKLIELLLPLLPLGDEPAMLMTFVRSNINLLKGHYEAARVGFIEAIEHCERIPVEELMLRDFFVATGEHFVAQIDAMRGIHSEYIERTAQLSGIRSMVGSKHNTLRLVALNRGDREAAERHRVESELWTTQTNLPSMYIPLGIEMDAIVLGSDFIALKRILHTTQRLAERYPGWRAQFVVVRAMFVRLRGEADEALASVQEVWKLPHGREGLSAVLMEIALQTELGEVERRNAHWLAQEVLKDCQEQGLVFWSHSARILLANAEITLGLYDSAESHLLDVSEAQRTLGVTGLRRAWCFEVLALLAVHRRDQEALYHYIALAMEQIGGRESSVARARLDVVLQKARAAGMPVQEGRMVSTRPATLVGLRDRYMREVSAKLDPCKSRGERMEQALALLGQGEGRKGFLVVMVDGQPTLVASNVVCDGREREDVQNFCVNYVNLHWTESDERTVTVTVTDDGVEPRWVSRDQQGYCTLDLVAESDGEHWFVGLALLSGENQQGSTVLGSALALKMMQSGDVTALNVDSW